MQLISIASLRRAADRVGKTGPVTEERIAHELNIERRVISHYIKGVTNLKAELGIKKSLVRSATYTDALRLLQERGLLITVRRIAYLSRASKEGVRGWLDRNRVHIVSVCTEHEIRRYAIVQRARWQVRSCRNDLGRLNKRRLASKIGMERSAFFCFLKKWPSFRAELESTR